jgi:hypothetical protein
MTKSNHPPSYSQSSTSGDSTMMLMQDEVVFRERNIYAGDRGRPRGMTALTATGGGGGSFGGSSSNHYRFLNSQHTQASVATSPGTQQHLTQSSLHSSHKQQGSIPIESSDNLMLPRHERKRRVRAIEDADRADAEHAGAFSPLDMSPPFANVSCRSHSGSSHNPFAMLEALVVPQQQQQQQQHHHHHDPEQRAENERSRSDDDDNEAYPGSQSASKDRAGRTEPLQLPRSHGSAPPSSPKKRRAPLGSHEQEDTLTRRNNNDEEDSDSCRYPSEVGHVGARCQLGDAASREVSARWSATGDRPPRAAGSDNSRAKAHRPPLRRNELSDHTNTGPSRGAAAVQSRRRAPPPAPLAPPSVPHARSFLDDPRSTSTLQHSHRQLSKAAAAARRASSKVSSGSVGSSSFSKAKAVVRASSRSIVGSRCVATD